MTAMFPDSGVPPQDARNTILDPDTQNCNELWYSTSRCQPRFDPAAANAALAELINLINAGEVSYDCAKLDQVQLAVKYLIQRGEMKGTVTTGGPLNYVGNLVPPATRYNDYMEVTIIPNVDNGVPATLSLNGLPFAPIVHVDGTPLAEGEMKANVPQHLQYYMGKWFWLGIPSAAAFNQPKALFLTGAIASIPFATYVPMPLTLVKADYLTPTIIGGNMIRLPAATYLFLATGGTRIVVNNATQVAEAMRVDVASASVGTAYEFTYLLAGQDASMAHTVMGWATVTASDLIRCTVGGGTTYAADMQLFQGTPGTFAALRIGP